MGFDVAVFGPPAGVSPLHDRNGYLAPGTSSGCKSKDTACKAMVLGRRAGVLECKATISSHKAMAPGV